MSCETGTQASTDHWHAVPQARPRVSSRLQQKLGSLAVNNQQETMMQPGQPQSGWRRLDRVDRDKSTFDWKFSKTGERAGFDDFQNNQAIIFDENKLCYQISLDCFCKRPGSGELQFFSEPRESECHSKMRSLIVIATLLALASAQAPVPVSFYVMSK